MTPENSSPEKPSPVKIPGHAAAHAETGHRRDDITRFHDTPLAQEAAFLIARVRGLGNAAANRRLAPLGLKVRDFAVLSMACSDARPSQRELGRFLDLDPSQVVALVDRLERRGALRREVDPQDRRSKILVGTPEGHRLHEQAAEQTQLAHEELFACLTERERQEVLRLLSAVVFAADRAGS
ncbi:MarR family winged helix-turn-helix transcriptional regulator [Nesterenkonia sp. K-15-9-6]|uniref:MarR family winged helix-turn-helix transcriptional regulator n=1 Tax=Nesterenkonia sp. K-15-9-6 TaxID=3093918 RepID=UPI0040444A8C